MAFIPTKAEIVEFLNAHDLCVVSTLGANGEPMSATVAFSENDKLELIIGTSTTSRKYANLTRDQRVAVNVTDPDKRYTVQYQGTAQLLTAEQMQQRADRHYAKLPGSLPFKDLPNQGFFLISPKLVRFSDCSAYPWQVTEFSY